MKYNLVRSDLSENNEISITRKGLNLIQCKRMKNFKVLTDSMKGIFRTFYYFVVKKDLDVCSLKGRKISSIAIRDNEIELHCSDKSIFLMSGEMPNVPISGNLFNLIGVTVCGARKFVSLSPNNETIINIYLITILGVVKFSFNKNFDFKRIN